MLPCSLVSPCTLNCARPLTQPQHYRHHRRPFSPPPAPHDPCSNPCLRPCGHTQLDAALLTESEMGEYTKRWSSVPDPDHAFVTEARAKRAKTDHHHDHHHHH